MIYRGTREISEESMGQDVMENPAIGGPPETKEGNRSAVQKLSNSLA